MDDAAVHTLVDVAPYAVGWAAGWFALWRPRPLPPATGPREAVAVVVPARDESAALTTLLPPLVASLRPGDELVVVDDHSGDGTAEVARRLGAQVDAAPELSPGWLGKPNACRHGASITAAPVLLFVDADVRPDGDLVDRLASAVARHPDRLVSVQPWHEVERPAEQLSVLCNVAALMGVGAFSALGTRVTPRTAFGPVLAVRRDVYERVGGHANPAVRDRHTEDIALARTIGAAELHTGRPGAAFRMYPGGLVDVVRGWSRSLATGAGSTPWWAALMTAAWIWSLAGGWLAVPWVYPLSAVQVWVLGRRAGRFAWWIAVLYPVAVVAFVVIFLRSVALVVLRRDVTWKDRRVAAR